MQDGVSKAGQDQGCWQAEQARCGMPSGMQATSIPHTSHLLTMQRNAALTSEQPFVLVPCQGGSLCNRCLEESEGSAIHF